MSSPYDPYADLDRIVRDLANTPAAELAGRTFRIGDESPERDAERAAGETPTVDVSWAVLAAANETETMAEIALLAVGESTILGQCDPIERLT